MNTDPSNGQKRRDMSGMGYLVVHVTTARGAIPLEGALVSIRNYDNSPQFAEGGGDVMVTLVSGRDGNTARYPLPAPPRAESQSPGKGDGEKPYSSYTAEVRLEGYRDQSYVGIPIFDGITAVQPADMIPLPEDGRSDCPGEDSGQYFTSSEPEL